MKKNIVPIVSIVVGIVAFFLTLNYIRSREAEIEALKQEIYAGAQQIRVMAAARDIPSGTVIRADDLGTITVFSSNVGNLAVLPADGEMLIGKRTVFSIKAREPVMWSHIEGGMVAERGLSAIINPGLRAISLAVSGPAAVSGMLQPNDRVDILGTFTFPAKDHPGEMESVTLTVLQDVTVLATGQQTAHQRAAARDFGGRAAGYSSVTVEVTPREAEVLTFAQQLKGSLTLSLRNPGDVSFERNLPDVNFKHIEEKLPELNERRQREIRHKRNI